MSNASLKDQLQAVASQLSNKLNKEQSPQTQKKPSPQNKIQPKAHARPQERVQDKPKKPKPKWLDYVQYGVELLRAYFPAAFKKSNEMQPLKKGIKQDLILRLSTLENIVTEDKACMVKSLAYYVNTGAYYKSVFEGAVRIDLDGNPAELVSAEEAKYSSERHQAKLIAKQAIKPVQTPSLVSTTEDLVQ